MQECIVGASVVARQVEEGEGEAGGVCVSAAGREWRVYRGLCGGLELVGGAAVNLHGLPGEQQTDVPMEVDLPRLRTLEPGRDRRERRKRQRRLPDIFQVWCALENEIKTASLPQINEVAQGACLAEGLPAALTDCVAADGNREGPLAQERLVSGRHGSEVVHHNKHLHHCLVGIE